MSNLLRLISLRGCILICLLSTIAYKVQGQPSAQETKTFTVLEHASKTPLNVEVLDLSNQLLPSFPYEILSFTNLRKLFLNDTHIPYIPDEIGTLTHLKVLELNHLTKANEVLKTLPPGVKQLKNLETVGLIGLPNLNWKETIILLEHLPNLNNLALMNNKLKTLPERIKNLTSLKQIWLGGNMELNPSEVFDKLPCIEQVGFGGSELSELPANVFQAKELFNLYLAGNHITSLSALLNNRKLKNLSLRNNNLTKLPLSLSKLELSVLELDNNPNVDWEKAFEVLSTMKSLKRLSLSQNKLSQNVSSFAYLSHLEVLVLRDNEFSQEQKDSIMKSLPKTKIVF